MRLAGVVARLSAAAVGPKPGSGVVRYRIIPPICRFSTAAAGEKQRKFEPILRPNGFGVFLDTLLYAVRVSPARTLPHPPEIPPRMQ
jgi:hypothetical protein